jgi:hypothetical protein
MTKFQKGQSGNPAGKPKGTRNKTTVILEALLDGKAEALTKKAIEMAGNGDPAMMRLCIERLIPPRKDRPINFELPALTTTQDASLAMLKILESVAKGELTPSEAGEISKVIENYAETVRLSELEARIAEMEARR